MLTLAALAWAADLYRSFGLLLINEQFNAFMLALALALVFLTYRVRKHSSARVPWYDIAAAVIGMAAAFYVAYDYRALSDAIAFRPLHGVIIGSILLVLVFEGLRRSSGNVLAGILIVFIAYGFLGWLLPGDLQGRHVSVDGLLVYLALDVNGVFGSVFGVACTVVVSFLFFGALLARSGGANFFTDLAIAAFGGFRGGAAKIAIIASSLFGTISGNAVSNVVSTGIVTIPMMKKSGYKPHVAGAIEAVASTGGQLMPPIMGAAAFIMAELLARPYSDIVIAATCRPSFIMRRCSSRPTWKRQKTISRRCRARKCVPCGKCCAKAGISPSLLRSSSSACSGSISAPTRRRFTPPDRSSFAACSAATAANTCGRWM